MAQIALYMNATAGIAKEQCEGCGRDFERGERMAAVESSDGEPMGWFCDDCIDDWKRNGVKSKIFSKPKGK